MSWVIFESSKQLVAIAIELAIELMQAAAVNEANKRERERKMQMREREIREL